jgi:hypothetical protein
MLIRWNPLIKHAKLLDKKQNKTKTEQKSTYITDTLMRLQQQSTSQ